jgi:hypothetical protein
MTEIPSYENMRVMLVVLADSNKVTPYVSELYNNG